MASETLRIWRGAEYTDVTEGFTKLQVTRVRNAAGELSFSLEATTVAALGELIDEVSAVDLWMDGACVERYIVDSFSPSWSTLTCGVRCVGLFATAVGRKRTETATRSAATWLEVLAAAAGLTVGSVAGGAASLALAFDDADIAQAIQDICGSQGLTFWIDSAGEFNAEPMATGPDLVYEMGVDAFEFGCTYTARDIVNRAIVRGKDVTATYDHAGSQALYGVRPQTFDRPEATTAGELSDYANWVFENQAYPRQEIQIEVDSEPSSIVGRFAEVTGLGDGRTYSGPVVQMIWGLGESRMEVYIGHPPTALKQRPTTGGGAGFGGGLGLPEPIEDPTGGEGAEPDTTAVSRLVWGVIESVEGATCTVDVGGDIVSGVRYLDSYTPTEGDNVMIAAPDGVVS